MLLPSGTIQYVEHDRLVPEVVPFDPGKDTNRPRVMFATPAYVIHQCERPFYEWTDVDLSTPSQECSLACLAFVSSLFQTAWLRLEDNHCHAMSGEPV